MPDGDRRKTMKLSKGGNKPAAPGGSPAETRKHDDPPAPPAAKPAAPASGGDQVKTQVFRAGEGGSADTPAAKPQAQSPAAAPSPPEDDTRTRVFRPGSGDEAAAPMRDDPPGEAAAPQAESQRVSSPVVGWLVVVSGPGAGGYRGIFDGRNRIGRTPQADIPPRLRRPGYLQGTGDHPL